MTGHSCLLGTEFSGTLREQKGKTSTTIARDAAPLEFLQFSPWKSITFLAILLTGVGNFGP